MITTFKGLQNSSVFKKIKKKRWKTILSVGKLWVTQIKSDESRTSSFSLHYSLGTV